MNMIKLTPELNAAIGEIPYKFAIPIVMEINKQIQAASKQDEIGKVPKMDAHIEAIRKSRGDNATPSNYPSQY